jgi:tetratricopeptide (TPR) repeat protein
MADSREELLQEGLDVFAAGDMSAAVELLDQALSLLPADDPVRLDVMPKLASAVARTGELARAEALLSDAVDEAVAAGDRRRELRALVERASWRLQSDPASEQEAHQLVERAIPEFEELGDELGLAKAWHLSADVQPTWATTTEALEQALVHARSAGDRREEADIIWWLGVSMHHGPTPTQEAIGRCEELLAQVRGDRTVEAGMLGMLAGLYAMRGRFEDAREFFARGIVILEELGIKLRMATRRTISGEIELLADDPAAAERELRWGYERLLEMGERGDLPAIAAQLAEALYRQRRFDEAERFTAISENAFAGAGSAGVRSRAVRAKLLASRGEFERAEVLAREAVALAENDDRLAVRGDAVMDLAETLRMAGRSGDAVAAARDALRLYEAKGNDVSAGKARALLEGLAANEAGAMSARWSGSLI